MFGLARIAASAARGNGVSRFSRTLLVLVARLGRENLAQRFTSQAVGNTASSKRKAIRPYAVMASRESRLRMGVMQKKFYPIVVDGTIVCAEQLGLHRHGIRTCG